MTITKICRRCGKETPFENLVKHKRCTFGVEALCRQCDGTIRRERELLNLEHARERKRKAAQAWRQANPQKNKANKRQFYRNNTGSSRQSTMTWRSKHPESVVATRQRRRARKRSVPATFTVIDWQRALDYFGGCCAVCGRPRGLWHTLAQDHWIPVAKGGAYAPNNIIPLCHGIDGCNNHKAGRDPVEWLTTTYGAAKAKKILKRIAVYFEWIKDHR